jgi:thiamine-phosphate pyrophosphorylase
MKYLVVSVKNFIAGEDEYITALFESGLELFHLRKPKSTQAELAELVSKIPEKYHKNIITHSSFELLNDFSLRGVHLTGKTTYKLNELKNKNCHISMSCNSYYDVFLLEYPFNYVIIGPVFDSISQPKFKSCFTEASLNEFFEKYDGKNNVFAFRGVNHDKLDIIHELGFKGAAFQGAVWQESLMGDMEIFKDNFITLKEKCEAMPS